MANTLNFGQRLHKALGGGSYQDVTKFLNQSGLKTDYDTVRRYILNQRRPDFETLAHLAQIAKVSVDWLVFGDAGVKQEEASGKADFELRKESGLNGFRVDELAALKKFADARSQTIEMAARALILDGLRLRGAITKPIPLETVSLNNVKPEQLVTVDLWGEIGDADELTPKHEKVLISARMIPEFYLEELPDLHPSFVHVYRVTTDNLRSQNVISGDLIVSGSFGRIGWSATKDNSRPVLVKTEDSKVLLRRAFRDPFDTNKFIFRPVREFEPIERLSNINLRDMECIFGVIT